MEINNIQKELDRLGSVQAWNHNFELPNGLMTSKVAQKSHGKNIVKYNRIQHILDKLNLDGKKVLDMGCNEGFFSLKLEERGASVVGIDIDEYRIEKANFIKGVVKPNAKIEYKKLDIYSQQFEVSDKFDFCLCLGFIHRVPDPFKAVSALASKSDIIIFEWKALKFGSHYDSFAYFSSKDVDHKDYYGTEYWLLTYRSLQRILERSGFNKFYKIDDPVQNRAIMVAGRIEHEIFNLPNSIKYKNKIKIILSHTKRFLKDMNKILNGEINC
jgi:SAM-dependent methyltransferase